MYRCSKCEARTLRRFFFNTCGHGICVECAVNILFDGENILCCCGPICPICHEVADIDAQTYPNESHRLVEMPLD